jgi:hypothetical protein
MVSGYLESQEKIAAVLDRMRHPIRLTRAATQVASPQELPKVHVTDVPNIPVFTVPATGMTGRQVLQKWEQAGSGHAVVELSIEDLKLLPDVVRFELRDATLEQIAAQMVGSPFIVVPRGEEDDRVHIRRSSSAPPFRFEDIPRAYDVSAILAHSQAWIEYARDYAGNDKSLSKEEVLINMISCEIPRDRSVSYLNGDPQLASCWNGILLLREAPEVHVRVLRYLEHLQRTGRSSDPPPDQ